MHLTLSFVNEAKDISHTQAVFYLRSRRAAFFKNAFPSELCFTFLHKIQGHKFWCEEKIHNFHQYTCFP